MQLPNLNYALHIVPYLVKRLLQKSGLFKFPHNYSCTGQDTADLIHKLLVSQPPCMIARYGSVEYGAFLRAELINNGLANHFPVKLKSLLGNNTGFFPVTHSMMMRFGELMRESTGHLDVIGLWNGPVEEFLCRRYATNTMTCPLWDISPFFSQNPWSRALAGRSVLVIHPFDQLIQKQYLVRGKLFSDERMLPDFELKTFRSVQSIAGNHVPYKTWFHALDYMKDKIYKIDFDIALIGCGAYGFPLAAAIKGMGKKAVHFGGALQLLFGIKGKRWDSDPLISRYYNEFWVRPSASEKVQGYENIESGCYW